jgi:ankyrin repeat protein
MMEEDEQDESILFQAAGDTPLLRAASDGNAKMIAVLLACNVDLYQRDGDGHTALHLALQAGSTKIVQMLLEAGFDPNKARNQGVPKFASLMDIVVITLVAWLVKKMLSFVDSGLSYLLDEGSIKSAISWSIWIIVFGSLSYLFYLLFKLGRASLRGPSFVTVASSFNGQSESMIMLLLDANIELEDTDKEILWSHAASRGYRDVCSRMLARGCTVDQKIFDKESVQYITALQSAARASHPGLVSLLLNSGADPTRKDSCGRSVLVFACESSPGRTDDTEADTVAVLELLLRTDAVKAIDDIFQNDQASYSGILKNHGLGWALGEACSNNQPEVVRMLLGAGANPDIRDDSGLTALHVAAKVEIKDQAPMCNTLIAHGANVNFLTDDGWSPLGYAIYYGSVGASAENLIKAGAAVGEGGGIYGSTLQLAARHELAGGTIFRLMLEYDDSAVNTVSGKFGTSLRAALNRAKWPNDPRFVAPLEYVKALFDHGADLNLTPNERRPPIVIAAEHQSIDVLRFLLENGAVIKKECDEQILEDTDQDPPMARTLVRTSILSWVETCDADKFDLLLNHGAPAECDSLMRPSWTNLEYACCLASDNYVRTATLLLQHGANPNTYGWGGGCPLHRAAQIRSQKHVSLLLDYGADAATCSPVLGTPLHSLCKSLEHQIIRDNIAESFFGILALLLSASSVAELCRPDQTGATPFHTLIALAEQSEVKYGASNSSGVEPTDSQIEPLVVTFLMELGEHSTSIIRHLLLARDSKGCTPLHIAAQVGDVHVLSFLLSLNHLDFDVLHADSQTEARHSPFFDQEGIAWTMIRDDAGWSLLHHAAANGRALMCAYLLVDEENLAPGRIALVEDIRAAAELAASNDHPKLAKYIRECLPSDSENLSLETILRSRCPSQTTIDELVSTIPVWYPITQDMLEKQIRDWDEDHRGRDGLLNRA